MNYLLDYIGSETVLTLPENVNGETYEIYAYAFYRRAEITSVIFSDGVTSIGSSAFTGCKGLTSVSMGNNVVSLSEVTCNPSSPHAREEKSKPQSVIFPRTRRKKRNAIHYLSAYKKRKVTLFHAKGDGAPSGAPSPFAASIDRDLKSTPSPRTARLGG